MTSVFDSLPINQLVLDNRFVRSATMDSMGKDGLVTEPEIELYRELGKGEIGLIISHGLYPTLEGRCSPGQLSVHSDDSIKPLSRLVKTVHQEGGNVRVATVSRIVGEPDEERPGLLIDIQARAVETGVELRLEAKASQPDCHPGRQAPALIGLSAILPRGLPPRASEGETCQAANFSFHRESVVQAAGDFPAQDFVS